MPTTAKQHQDSVICTLPQGGEIEIIMVSVEGKNFHAESDLKSAQTVLMEMGFSESEAVGSTLKRSS